MRAKILLVDDDSAVRRMIGRLLTEAGFLVLPAGDGQQALELAAATNIDLVLLDLNLAGKDGWNVYESLTRENPLVPIIIITGRSNQLFTTLAAGAGALMEKPLDAPRLLEMINALLEEPAQTRLERLAGGDTEFHYWPTGSRNKP